MRKPLLFLLLFVLACNTLLPAGTPTPIPTPAASPTPSVADTPTAVPATPPAAISSTPLPDPEAEDFTRRNNVRFHPGPQLYSGDVVSLEVEAPGGSERDWSKTRVSLYVGEGNGEPLAREPFGAFGIGGRAQATFWWVWDTAGLEGEQTLVIRIEPEDGGDPLYELPVVVHLLPAEERPSPEREAQWAQAESECCLFHYLTHTAAARDIELIKTEADAAFDQVEAALQVEREDKVRFTLLSRLLGHGGFASSEISLTYIDRNPAGLNLPNVFMHEGVHILDRQIAKERPLLFTEGLAVYIAGGHYKPEKLDQRAAALLVLDRYLPLEALTRDFYPSQHEIGYLEAGALIQYLVDTYGWETFRAMYTTFKPASNDVEMLEAGLQAHYGKSLAEIEAEWLAHLRALPVDEDEVEDLRLSVELFDTLRRYQQMNDPAAYYLTAWLPDGPTARQRHITADFIRSPRAPENIALETMLAAAEQALSRREFEETEALLASINAVLDANNLFFDPLAARYLRAVNDLAAQGYEAQTIDLFTAPPRVTAIRDWPVLESVTYNSD